MKDRTAACIHYVAKGFTCKKGFVNVDMSKCKNCSKYQPRISKNKTESIREKRQKDKDRHDKDKEW